VKKIQ